MKGLCGVEREPEHFLLDLITKTCHKHPICCFVAPLSLVRHSPQCCFSLIRAEFTSKLRLRAHLFAANSAFLNQEPDKSSTGVGFSLDHYKVMAQCSHF